MAGGLPMQEVSQAEEADLSHMRQEEKPARDVYAALYQKWQMPAFANISASGQRHMDATKLRAFNTLLTAHGQSCTAQALSQQRYGQMVMGAYEMGLCSHDGKDMCQ